MAYGPYMRRSARVRLARLSYSSLHLSAASSPMLVLMLFYFVLWCPFNTPASAVGVGGGGFHGICSVGGGAQPLKMLMLNRAHARPAAAAGRVYMSVHSSLHLSAAYQRMNPPPHCTERTPDRPPLPGECTTFDAARVNDFCRNNGTTRHITQQ
jgi:hypothetical protein